MLLRLKWQHCGMPGRSQSIWNAYIQCQCISKIGFSDFKRTFNGNNLFESCTVKGQKYSYGKIGFHSTSNEWRALRIYAEGIENFVFAGAASCRDWLTVAAGCRSYKGQGAFKSKIL
jgi:hypothetical protein